MGKNDAFCKKSKCMETRDIFIIGNIEAKTDVTQLIPSQPNPVILDLNTLN